MAGTFRNDSLGRYGERLAARYLAEHGYVVLARNWRCPIGELDLVLRDGADLVVCEVKTRRATRYGAPVEAVTAVKAMRLRRLAAQWLHDHHDSLRAGPPVADVRIDVVGVLRPPHGPAVVEHLVGVA